MSKYLSGSPGFSVLLVSLIRYSLCITERLLTRLTIAVGLLIYLIKGRALSAV